MIIKYNEKKMQPIKKKTIAIIILVIFSYSGLFAFENNFFTDDLKYDIFNSQVSLYSITNNPAFFKITFNENITKYSLTGSKKNNFIYREYSPKQEQNNNLEIITSKNLNSNSTMASVITYNQDIKFDMKHSLEKDFYSHYFSFSDTTTGDTKFAGPQLQFLFNHSLNDKIYLGVKGNYGIEQ